MTEARERLRSRRYDVIVSDYQMPGTNGIPFLKELRNQGDSIPFIIFTGKGREEIVIEAINSGADFYLQKGGDPNAQFAELRHKVRQAAQRWTAERSVRAREILGIPGIRIRECGEHGKGARFELLVPEGRFRQGSDQPS